MLIAKVVESLPTTELSRAVATVVEAFAFHGEAGTAVLQRRKWRTNEGQSRLSNQSAKSVRQFADTLVSVLR